jgi:hypothetical protein
VRSVPDAAPDAMPMAHQRVAGKLTRPATYDFAIGTPPRPGYEPEPPNGGAFRVGAATEVSIVAE